MKKYLLLILTMLSVSIGAWAEVTVTGKGTGTITISSEDAGDINTGLSIALNYQSISDTRIIVQGKVNLDDLTKIKSSTSQSWDDFTFDFSGLTEYPALNTWPKMWQESAGYPVYILPKGCSGFDESMTTYVSDANTGNGIFNVYGDLRYIIIPASAANNPAYIYIYKRKGTQSIVTDLASDDKSYFTGNESKIEVLGLNGAGAESSWSTLITNLKANGTWGSKISLLPYSVSGCDVTINIESAEAGQTLADLIVTAKAAVIAGGQTGICTLTVKGELTANDLIALGGKNMTGATRIDLSGATLASGVNLDNLQVPASLTSIVLPKNQTVNVGLAAKFAAAANLNYAYSPSTDPDEADPTVADYVWVNKEGGMAAALAAETSLRGSKYIKVASNVALNASDVDFSSTTALKYLDLRYANFTSAVSSSFVSSSATGYRIILPNDWTEAEMATFGDTTLGSVAWAMAGIYSYSGTTLRIHELTDGKYMTTALSNSRIVYDGTTAIKIVGTRLGENLLAALNAAASSVKTITVTASSLNDLTFTNSNITTLNVTGLTLNTTPGRITVDDDCTSLTTLNVTDCSLMTVVATGVNSLTTVNLNGTTISGETNLSNTGLTTFTTNSSTKLQGDINLMSTALTSLNTTAEIGSTTAGTGNILLNGCTSLASITLGSAQFKNETSMIHIDKSTTEDEGNTDAIDLLSKTETVGGSPVAVKTIFVPNSFASSTRIHPYDEVQNNVSEVAGSSANGDTDGCTITYDATTKVATVHTTDAGHFASMMETRYGNYPLGTTFKFDATSKINVADLQALAGKINANDYSWRSNYYYVDLYDLPASAALCDNTTGVIGQTISWLRTNNRQFKGLILPKDHTLYGSGISLIQSEKANTAGELSTCSEFIAYYKTKEIKAGASEATNLTKTILFTHVYNQTATNSEGIQASNDKLTELLTAHGLNGAGTNAADLYSVSTNGTTPFDATALVGSKGYIETFNNEMVGAPTKANIYAYPQQAGEYTTFVGSSSIGVTPTEVLKIDGTVSNDASAVAKAFNTFANGPRVLDLSEINPNDDTFLKGVLEKLTNDDIEYIILPEGKSKELVCNTTYSASMTNLKAVISTDGTDLVAYVKQAGSLAEARYLATGGSVDANTGMITPAQTGLQSVTLTGNLNAADIAANTTTKKVDTSGNWGSGSGNASSIALSSEQGTITTIDLEDAVFAVQTDMNFSLAGLGSIRNITLPTSSSMTLIPENCFNGITSFEDLCIPYNYTHIDNQALFGSYCGHITTTDANGALVDNGPKTYTFSKNLEEIGSKPAEADDNGVYSLSATVFPQNRGVTDVYVLAHQVPKCYANAFPANMLYGWGGFKGAGFPYCREKYDNSADGSMIFTVLHFPDEASFNASTDTGKETSYAVMKQKYTDVTKVYTKKEQTGAVDANGDPVAWPTFSELRRAYNQGTCGIIWDDWKGHYDSNNEVVEGFDIPTAKNAIAAATAGGEGQDANHSTLIKVTDEGYDFTGYEGWHQFSLSMASYVESEEQNAVEREYVQGGYYTFCIPFDMTEEQVYEMLGVPYSTNRYTNKVGSNVIKKADDVTGNERLLPEIYTLKYVKRTPNATKNIIALSMTENLATAGTYTYLLIDNSGTEPAYSYPQCGTNAAGEKIVIKGGYPYYIRPYILKGETIKNLGKYVLTRYADKFKQAASCANHDETMEYLGASDTDLATLKFAKPYEEHKIWAALDDDNDSTAPYAMHSDSKRYYYTFVGQFWDQKLPRYCYYTMEGTGNWYRLSADKNYTWNAYKCVILSTVEVDDGREGSGKYRDSEQSNYPSIEEGSTDKLDGDLKIGFQNGIDDYDFQNSARECIFLFNDDIITVEDGSETTAIEVLDGERVAPLKGKVYNMSGQHVGDSVEGLPKGMYIINGKKYIVK